MVTQSSDAVEQEIAKLHKRREELRARLASIEADYRSGLSADSEEQAIQLENAEVQAGIAKSIADELAQIEARLEELG